MEERVLYCYDCHKLFVFSIEEQSHFSSKGWDTPCRCPSCRKAKRERIKNPYAGWQSTMMHSSGARRGHHRVQYSGIILAGGLHA